MRRPARMTCGLVAEAFGLVGQVVGIDADAVAADQAGPKWQEVPLGAGRGEHLGGVDAHAVEDHREFVDQGDVQVALCVLDHLGGFGHADRAGPVRAGASRSRLERIDEVRVFGRRAGGDLDDVGQLVFGSPGLIRSGL